MYPRILLEYDLIIQDLLKFLIVVIILYLFDGIDDTFMTYAKAVVLSIAAYYLVVKKLVMMIHVESGDGIQ